MSDLSAKKVPSIPSWQRPQSSATTSESSPSDEENATNATTSPRQHSHKGNTAKRDEDVKDGALLEQARKFLQDPIIRDEPLERKQAFLQLKGLSSDSIDELLANSVEKGALKADVEPETSEEAANGWPKACRHADSPPRLAHGRRSRCPLKIV